MSCNRGYRGVEDSTPSHSQHHPSNNNTVTLYICHLTWSLGVISPIVTSFPVIQRTLVQNGHPYRGDRWTGMATCKYSKWWKWNTWHYIMLKGNWKLNIWDLYSIVSKQHKLQLHFNWSFRDSLHPSWNILQRSIMTYIPQIYKHNVPYRTTNASYQGSLSTRKWHDLIVIHFVILITGIYCMLPFQPFNGTTRTPLRLRTVCLTGWGQYHLNSVDYLPNYQILKWIDPTLMLALEL